MSVDSRLRNLEQRLRCREAILEWLKFSQAQGGFADYWKFGTFETWVTEHEEAGLLYDLVARVNCAVLEKTQEWSRLFRWASLLCLSTLAVRAGSAALEQYPVHFFDTWRTILCDIFVEVLALREAVDLLSEGHFDRHEVLFSDCREKLGSSVKKVELLILGYNLAARAHGKRRINMKKLSSSLGGAVALNRSEWVMLSRATVLAQEGRLLDARDQVLAFIAIADKFTKREGK